MKHKIDIKEMKERIYLDPPLAFCMIDEPKWKNKIIYGAETQKAIQLIIGNQSYWFCKKFIQMSSDFKYFFTEIWSLENKKEASYSFAFVYPNIIVNEKRLDEMFIFDKEKHPMEIAEMITNKKAHHGYFCGCIDCEPDYNSEEYDSFNNEDWIFQEF